MMLEKALELQCALSIICLGPSKGLADLILNEQCIRSWRLMHALGIGLVHMNHPSFR